VAVAAHDHREVLPRQRVGDASGRTAIAPVLQVDPPKSRADNFQRIPALSADGSRSPGPCRSQIARTRAVFYRFSEKHRNAKTGWWSEVDSNFRCREKSFRRKTSPIA